MALIYVTGGAKSGKSKFAEDLLLNMNNGNQKNIYLATSLIYDEEMDIKVSLHKKRRQDRWITVEGYKNFYESLEKKFVEIYSKKKEIYEKDIFINNMLVDCLTNMISNIIFENIDIEWSNPAKDQIEKCDEVIENEVEKLIEISQKFENVIIVSNELGMGIVPSYPLGRYFREIAGKMNQKIAEIALILIKKSHFSSIFLLKIDVILLF